ncbi:MAG: 2-oxoacid:acceptor oxidoreductase family protein [Proteobacteria bacterium]|nr:2-oxoacid:acceptor oxidoreductase family protein [Pseudomonadota bacterium]
MTSLLNRQRPPVFCPGCAHEVVVRGLDQTLQTLELSGNQVAIVSDIGCSGLFDTFFNTHAFHGLHGRALTYATGIKMARPELKVIVIMGDGGLGIGGAHVLSSCRRNLDITLLILNNFNYGMTGGQCSATTPTTGQTSSGFLNELEAPLDICRVAVAAGAPYVDRTMATGKALVDSLVQAIRYPGFSLIDIWGLCPGRYSKRNRISLAQMEEEIHNRGLAGGPVAVNEREEYSAHYHRLARSAPAASMPMVAAKICDAPIGARSDVLLLGSAGQFINTVGEILCLAGMSGGLHVSQKNDYPITVLRGHSIAEVVLDREPIDYTGIGSPAVVLCVAAEGVARRKKMFSTLPEEALVVKDSKLSLPETRAKVIDIDFSEMKIRASEQALAALAVVAREGILLNYEMLAAGLSLRYKGKMFEEALAVAERICGR